MPAAHLSLCEVQVDGDLVAPQPGQVVVVGELGLQLPQLLLGEGRALFAGLAAGVALKTGVLDVCGERGDAFSRGSWSAFLLPSARLLC